LSFAYIERAVLQGSSLRESIFVNVDVFRSNLNSADLRGAQLDGTDLSTALFDPKRLKR